MKINIFIFIIILFCLNANAQKDSLTNVLPIAIVTITKPCHLIGPKEWPKHFKGNGIPSLNLKIMPSKSYYISERMFRLR